MTAVPQVALFDGVGRPAHAPPKSDASLKVSAYRDLGAVLDIWAELEASVPHSIYQSRRWLVPWIETIGAANGIEPFFVVLRDRFQMPVGFLPLGIRRVGPIRVATFLGGKDANFGMGLIRPDLKIPPADLARLLRRAARQLGRRRPALVALFNQPLTWEGTANLLTTLPSQPAPSYAYETALPATGDAYCAATLSKDTRKKLRRKEARLAELAPVRHVVAASDEASAAVVQAFYAQKTARLEARGISATLADGPGRRFMQRTTTPSVNAPVEVHALFVGERIVATLFGATYRNRFSGMVNSFDEDPDIARSSPGDLLLTKAIAAKCESGVAQFDLGIGEARYKDMFCPVPVPLVDSLVAVSPAGHLGRLVYVGRLRLKRVAKQNARLVSLVAAWRRLRRS